MPDIILSERYCPCCKQNKELTKFIPDFRERNQYLPFCKSCTDNIVKTQTADLGLVGAIWSAAMVNNVPFIEEAYNSCKQIIVETSPKSPFATYYRSLKNTQGAYNGVWESDCWYKKPQKVVQEEPEEDDTAELIKEWGKFVDENGEIEYEAYDYFVSRYEEYTSNVEGLTNAMAMQYRNLCKAEWQKMKADEGGDIGEIAKAQKQVDSLLATLKLDDFTVDKTDTEKFIDRLIWRIEETEPAELEDRDKYVDITGYEAMYNSIMRSMKNMIAGSREYPDIPMEEM